MDARISRSLRWAREHKLRIEFHPEVSVDRLVCTDLLFSMLTTDEPSYRIASHLTKGIGPVIARKASEPDGFGTGHLQTESVFSKP